SAFTLSNTAPWPRRSPLRVLRQDAYDRLSMSTTVVMTTLASKSYARVRALRDRADQVFSRSAGAPLVGGNHVQILRDARENSPAWEDAIRNAKATIHIEMYIVHRDHFGRRFRDLLAERARAG